MKFYIDIYYIFFIKKSVADMLYGIRQHDHTLIGGKMKENKELGSINLCTYFTLCVLITLISQVLVVYRTQI